MNPFAYQRAESESAARLAIKTHGAKFLAGGTNLVDLMKYDVEKPSKLIDVTRAASSEINDTANALWIGAGVKNSALANHPAVLAKYPLLSQALLSGASPQLRNMATTGGNLLQRTRCYYFMDTAFAECNKRAPGSGCAAVKGFNRIHAVLGQTDEGTASPHTCIATNPSDMNVALHALGAMVSMAGPKGNRMIPIAELHRLPGATPHIDTTLHADEMIIAVVLPTASAKFAKNFWYLKVRDRQSYAFALVSVAAGLEMDGETIRSAGLALGGVAHKPWRSAEAEAALTGKTATAENFRKAAEAALAGAKGYEHNRFKIEMAKQNIVRALTVAAKGAQA